jgi:hypothetical protein
MLLTFCTLGVPIAEHKTEGPSLIIEFIGIIIDTQKMEARLPSNKLNRLFADLNLWHTKKVSYTPRAPITNWNIKFCMQRNCPGSSFSATYYKSNTGVSKPHNHIRLTNGFREDVKMWPIFLTGMGQVYFSTLSGQILQTFLSIRMPPGRLVSGDFPHPVVSG